MDDDLARFCCQNPDCSDHGQGGLGNLRVCFRYGQQQRRMLACRTCQRRFSERKGTALFDSRLSEGQVVAVLNHVAEGCGVRKTSRLVGVNKDTVLRYSLLAGGHARRLHDELVALSPRTREVQFDEKRAFVGKKQKHCNPGDPQDQRRGDHWDHVALDPEHRLVVRVVPGKRDAAKTHQLVRDFKRRTGGRLMNLMTSDEYPVYAEAIRDAYATTVVLPRTGKPGRPEGPRQVLPEGLKYATVHKTRRKGRVVKVEMRVVFGTALAVLAALAASLVSRVVNTVFVERHNGTDRNRNSRKVRKCYAFSKDWGVHEAVTYFTRYSYNFCWPVRTLREGNRVMGYKQRTPAMAAGLTDHVWSLREWLTFPAAADQRTDQVA